MDIRFGVTLACGLLVGTAVIAADVTRKIPVDGDFQDVSMRWNGATPGGYDARVALKENGGFINNGLRGGRLKINNKTVLKNFRFFAKAKGQVSNANANCVRTSHKSSVEIKSVDFKYGNATFRN